MSSDRLTDALPEPVGRVLEDFVEAAKDALGPTLRSVVLFGSAAEGQMRPTSDVNVILVLTAFDRARADRLREPLRVAYAAVRLSAMFLLDSEVAPAAEAFAQKFADVLRRRRILWGPDPFTGLAIPRDALLRRLRQVLLNLTIRLRALYVGRSLREEQLARAVADAAGPLGTCAASLLDLEGKPTAAPGEALRQLTASMGSDWGETLAQLAACREGRALAPRAAGDVLFRMLELASHMRARAEALR
jgi:predicted nucleotidyltransferase